VRERSLRGGSRTEVASAAAMPVVPSPTSARLHVIPELFDVGRAGAVNGTDIWFKT
jgi:hypothetical protein